MKLKHYAVSLDGLDKVGKSTIVKYLAKMSNYTLNILDRGPITNIVWNKIQKRDVTYDLEMWRSTLFVQLKADKEDWKIRCSINNEPPMPLSYEEMSGMYDAEFKSMKDQGFNCIEINTSACTPYMVAKKIIQTLEDLYVYDDPAGLINL